MATDKFLSTIFSRFLFSACPYGKFRCYNGECIEEIKYCDGYQDCSDNSDELECPERTTVLPPFHFDTTTQAVFAYPYETTTFRHSSSK